MDWDPLGSSVQGIIQARILEWVAISSSRGSPWPEDQTYISFIGRQILSTEPQTSLNDYILLLYNHET